MWIYLRLSLFLLLLSWSCSSLSAQSKKEIRKEKRELRKANTHKFRSPLMVYPVYWAMQDTRSTPGIYRNIGLGLSLRHEISKPNHQFENLFQFNIGAGRPNFEDGALMYSFAFVNETNYIRKIDDHISAGIQGFFSQHNRLIPALSNSSYNSDIIFGLGPLGKWKTSLPILKKETSINISISMPLVSFVNRIPEYGLSFSGVSSTVAFIGRFNRLSFRIDAKRLFRKSNENKINYFYRWEYHGMKEFEGLHNLRIATHQIGFHLWIKRN